MPCFPSGFLASFSSRAVVTLNVASLCMRVAFRMTRESLVKSRGIRLVCLRFIDDVFSDLSSRWVFMICKRHEEPLQNLWVVSREVETWDCMSEFQVYWFWLKNQPPYDDDSPSTSPVLFMPYFTGVSKLYIFAKIERRRTPCVSATKRLRSLPRVSCSYRCSHVSEILSGDEVFDDLIWINGVCTARLLKSKGNML